MKAIILAAGVGSRFSSLTKDNHKPLLEICGIPIIEKQIQILNKNKISNITIVTGYMSDLLESKISNYKINFVHNEIYKKTESLYSFWCARNSFDDDILCLYGDLIFEDEIISNILDTDFDMCLAVGQLGKTIDNHTVFTNNKIVKRINVNLSTEQVNGQYIGITKYSLNSMTTIKQILSEFYAQNDLLGEIVRIYEKLLNDDYCINASFTKNLKWFNINNITSLELARKFFCN